VFSQRLLDKRLVNIPQPYGLFVLSEDIDICFKDTDCGDASPEWRAAERVFDHIPKAYFAFLGTSGFQ
jgi:hypothetical protein